MADIPEWFRAFPDKVITMRRSYLDRERDQAKKYLQALAEASAKSAAIVKSPRQFYANGWASKTTK